jgi:deoxyribodipyrimidine photo-lyase
MTPHEKSGERPALLWLTRDLRLADNPALHAALQGGRRVVPIFVLDDAGGGEWALGAAARWWLHNSLTALQEALAQAGAHLVLRRGSAEQIVPEVAAAVGAAECHVARAYEPWRRSSVKAVAGALEKMGVRLCRHSSVLLFEPEQIRTKTGGSYGVYTPFSRACEAAGVSEDNLPAPTHVPGLPGLESELLDDWKLLPKHPDWAGGLRANWAPGEVGAAKRAKTFLKQALTAYDEARNTPAGTTTSMLSPHLHWGEISPRRLWHAARVGLEGASNGAKVFRNELLWREFSAHLLFHHPTLPAEPLRPEFAGMPWRDDAKRLLAWQRGRTGIPLVDAGMRQLWQIGWQHNRVRMVTASFLIKHLLIDWRVGQQWFWDTLVDADLASNAASWQWVAGSGADAAPFFRIFNPVLQGRKFDPAGTYVRRFVPELSRLPDRFLHAPWEAPEDVLAASGVRLGQNYPHPIVDLAAGRQQALDAFNALSRNAA